MGRAELAIGTRGAVTLTPYKTVHGKAVMIPKAQRVRGMTATEWKAFCRVRLSETETKQVLRSGPTKEAAQIACERAADELLRQTASVLNLRSKRTVEHVAGEWVEQIADDANYAPSSRRLYSGTITRYLIGTALGAMLPRNVRPTDIEDLLNDVAKSHGAGTAKTLRSTLSRVFSRAVRSNLTSLNPVREADRTKIPRGVRVTAQSRVIDERTGELTTVKVSRSHDRALEPSEVMDLLWTAYRTPNARQAGWAFAGTNSRCRDTADLIAFMLTIGVRVGEACAVRWQDIDLTAGQETVTICGTITRQTGVGLVRGEPKTRDSNRVIPLPLRTVALLRRRARWFKGSPSAPVFGAPMTGTWRDPSNTNADLRELLDSVGLTWATPHTFRRTVLTKLGDDGVPLRFVANLAGHTDPAMTARKYLGRGGKNEVLRGAL